MLNPDLLDLNFDEQGGLSQPLLCLLLQVSWKMKFYFQQCFVECVSCWMKSNKNYSILWWDILRSYSWTKGMIFLTLIHFTYFSVVVLVLENHLLKPWLNTWKKHWKLLVTAYIGKAAINVNGTTLHSSFGLPVREHITFTQLAWIKKKIFKKICESSNSSCWQDIHDFSTYFQWFEC